MGNRRNQNGEGHFRVKESGSIEYIFRYTDEYGRKRYKSVSGVDENHCYERAEQFLARLEQIKNGRDLDATIVQLVREKLENDYKKNHTGEQGYDRNLKTLGILERSSIGHIPICDIKPYHIDAFYNQITKYANNTIGKIHSMLKLAFGIAVRRKIITENLIEDNDLRCPISDKKDKKVRGMTEEEQKQFVSALEEYVPNYGSNSYKLQMLIELYSGMRMGEINALKPEDISFEQGFVHVERTISTGRDGHIFIKDGTKTKAGERDVPISRQLEELLKAAIDEMKDNPYGLIFFNHKKKSLISTSAVCSSYKRICAKAKVPYHGQHALRHTFATRCIEAGVPAIVLKNWLGHTDIHVTLDTYSDVFDRMNLGAISKFDELMKEVMTDEE